jgi:hypothetical protein
VYSGFPPERLGIDTYKFALICNRLPVTSGRPTIASIGLKIRYLYGLFGNIFFANLHPEERISIFWKFFWKNHGYVDATRVEIHIEVLYKIFG